MNSIAHNLQEIHQRILSAATRCGRDPSEITLVAVSKTKPASMVEEAMIAGQHIFGENYLQEGLEKIRSINAAVPPEWHFIGPVQSNKSRLVAENFAWCHTIDRLRIATRLSEQRPAHLPPLNVLIQINISDESGKSGIIPQELPALAQQIMLLPGLSLRGLMAIPAIESSYQAQLKTGQIMAQLLTSLKQQYPGVDTLSLGMSEDLEAAIEAGSTMIRIGSAIFGQRNSLNTTNNRE